MCREREGSFGGNGQVTVEHIYWMLVRQSASALPRTIGVPHTTSCARCCALWSRCCRVPRRGLFAIRGPPLVGTWPGPVYDNFFTPFLFLLCFCVCCVGRHVFAVKVESLAAWAAILWICDAHKLALKAKGTTVLLSVLERFRGA